MTHRGARRRVFAMVSAAFLLLTAMSACGDRADGGAGADGQADSSALSPFEDELVGAWSRFTPSETDPRTRYILFNADRTGCEWVESQGSSHARDRSEFEQWELRERTNVPSYRPSPEFEIVLHGDYAWPHGFYNSARREIIHPQDGAEKWATDWSFRRDTHVVGCFDS